MIIKLNAKAAGRAIKLASQTPENRNTIPVLTHALISDVDGRVRIAMTDLDIWCAVTLATHHGEIGSGDAILVPRPVIDFIIARGGIAKADDAIELEMETDGMAVTVRHGRARIRHETLLPSDFPSTENLTGEADYTFTLPADQLNGGIRTVLDARETLDTRPFLNGVFMTVETDPVESLTFVATDGKRMHVAETPLPEIEGGLSGIILPHKPSSILASVFSGGEYPVTISGNDRLISLEGGPADGDTIAITSRLIDGNYPVFRKSHASPCENRVTLDAGSLDTALSGLDVLRITESKAHAKLGPVVCIEPAPDGDDPHLKLSSKTVNGETADEVAASFEGDDITPINVSMRFLRAILAACGEGEATLSWKDATSPMHVTGARADASFTLMPVNPR